MVVWQVNVGSLVHPDARVEPYAHVILSLCPHRQNGFDDKQTYNQQSNVVLVSKDIKQLSAHPKSENQIQVYTALNA